MNRKHCLLLIAAAYAISAIALAIAIRGCQTRQDAPKWEWKTSKDCEVIDAKDVIDSATGEPFDPDKAMAPSYAKAECYSILHNGDVWMAMYPYGGGSIDGVAYSSEQEARAVIDSSATQSRRRWIQSCGKDF